MTQPAFEAVSSFGLDAKKLLITGAAGGVGLALVAGFQKAGAFVLASDRKLSPELDKLKNSVQSVEFFECDLTQSAALERLIERAVALKIDVLINNAAIFDMAPLLESGLDQFDRIFNINVRAPFRLMQAIAGDLIKRGQRGSILNFSSQAGRRGEALVSHYCASKAAIISHTQSAALAFAKNDIRVNAIAPGVIDTPMWDQVDALFARFEGLEAGEKKKQVGKAVPMGRMGVPKDIVGACLFLASDHAAYITGQTLNIDGGSVLN